jgi:Domain of unknown function (DUF1707)
VSRPRRFPGSDHHAQLRASDADRDQAVAQLGDHHVAGRLDLEEFTDRVSQALASKTLGELDLLFRDLPAPAIAPVARGRSHPPVRRWEPTPWRFRLHLGAYVIGCGGFVWASAFGAMDGIAYGSDWPLVAFLGWGAAVAWQGLRGSRQRGIARPNG